MNKGMSKSAARVISGMDAIDAILQGAGLQKSAADSGFGKDPNDMTPPGTSEFDLQRAELKAAVPNSTASDANFNNGTPIDGPFQGADGANEVTDAPEVTPTETPQETDAGTESPAQVDVNNVEGKSASFAAQVQTLIKQQGLAKAAHIAGAFSLEQLDAVLGAPAGKSTKSAAVNDEWAGKFAAAEDFINVLQANPEGFLQEKVAAVAAGAVEDADTLYTYLCEKAAEDAADLADEEADALEEAAMAEEAGGQPMPQGDMAALEAIAGGEGMGDGDADDMAPPMEEGNPLEGVSDEELIAALSEALDANGAAPEELPEMEAAALPAEMPPVEKEASIKWAAQMAANVNLYRNALRTGKAREKRASVSRIQLTAALSQEIANMMRR